MLSSLGEISMYSLTMSEGIWELLQHEILIFYHLLVQYVFGVATAILFYFHCLPFPFKGFRLEKGHIVPILCSHS